MATSPNTGCREPRCIEIEIEDPDEEDDPCDKLQENSQNPDFLSKLNYLKNNTNLNQEVGFTRTESITGSPNSSIEFQDLNWVPIYSHLTMNTVSGQLFSDYGHIHFDSENQLSVFSLSDIYTIFTLLDTGHIYDENFTAYLVTAHDTKYALQFKDLESVQNFADFGNEWFTDWNMMNMPKEYSKRVEIEKIFKYKYKIKTRSTNQNDKNEKNFAKFLLDNNLGMDLYKSNENFTEWEKINPDGTTTPCN